MACLKLAVYKLSSVHFGNPHFSHNFLYHRYELQNMFYFYEYLVGSKFVLGYAYPVIRPEVGLILRIWFLELSEYKSHTSDRFTSYVLLSPLCCIYSKPQ